MGHRFYNKIRSQAGFTFIEVITSVFIFSIIAGVTTGIFVRAIQLQQSSFNAQRIVENSIFLLEMMTRDIRVSQICPVTSPACAVDSIYIQHPVKGVVRYFLDVTRGVVRKTEGGSTVDITSSDVNFTRFDLLTTGLGIDDNQPRVRIIASIQNSTGRIIKFNLQTTITSRDVSEEFQN